MPIRLSGMNSGLDTDAIVKSHLDMCMIGTELKGEMLRFLYLAASMSSTISLYNRTFLRQYLENSDKM